MLALISPAKKLDFETETTVERHSFPAFLDKAEELVSAVRKLSQDELARMMKLSDSLAELNYQRFKAFSAPFDLGNAKQAALVFNGDTYVGLEAASLDEQDLEFAQDHVGILSGLYGLLRPLDLIQPYRLEMGARFTPPHANDLYGFWKARLTEAVNDVLRGQKDQSVVNLASTEYFKAINPKTLIGPVVTPIFKEIKNGEARMLGMFAKRARGMMARFIIKKRLTEPELLKTFTGGGYEFRPDLSDERSWVFTREQP